MKRHCQTEPVEVHAYGTSTPNGFRNRRVETDPQP